MPGKGETWKLGLNPEEIKQWEQIQEFKRMVKERLSQYCSEPVAGRIAHGLVYMGFGHMDYHELKQALEMILVRNLDGRVILPLAHNRSKIKADTFQLVIDAFQLNVSKAKPPEELF